MKTFLTNKVAAAPVQKSSTLPSSLHDHLKVPLETKKPGASVKSIARYLFQNRRYSASITASTDIPPSLSTSTSISSIHSSTTIPKKTLIDTQSSKSMELESLIVEQPMRTVRVNLTPDCAA
ncbi:hypothetical protein BX666DRAFT_1894961 [Dichotomocladium elegans]|nr:hypothetical protein BX666DRAFT_1894961 [Dichotomocladium elegans]